MSTRRHTNGSTGEPHADWPQAITLGADKAYDAEDFVNEMRSIKVTRMWRRIRADARRRFDGRTRRHAGYAVSQRIRKRIEEAFENNAKQSTRKRPQVLVDNFGETRPQQFRIYFQRP